MAFSTRDHRLKLKVRNHQQGAPLLFKFQRCLASNRLKWPFCPTTSWMSTPSLNAPRENQSDTKEWKGRSYFMKMKPLVPDNDAKILAGGGRIKETRNNKECSPFQHPKKLSLWSWSFSERKLYHRQTKIGISKKNLKCIYIALCRIKKNSQGVRKKCFPTKPCFTRTLPRLYANQRHLRHKFRQFGLLSRPFIYFQLS